MLDGRTEEQVRLKALSQLLSNSLGLEVRVVHMNMIYLKHSLRLSGSESQVFCLRSYRHIRPAASH